ncbi:MAG: RHS repeat-associated core domain-containing protein [Rhodothermaceae bacterium]
MPPTLYANDTLYVKSDAGKDTLMVFNIGVDEVNWNVSESIEWLTIINSAGTTATEDSTVVELNVLGNPKDMRQGIITFSNTVTGKATKVLVIQEATKWKTVSYNYNNLGMVKTVNVNNRATFTNEYDSYARLERTKSNGKTDAVYGYNNLDQVTTLNLPEINQTVSYSYDYTNKKRGFLESVTSSKFSESLGYLSNGNVKTQTVTYNGVIDGVSSHTYTYSYDGVNRLTSAANSESGYSESYSYDGDGAFMTKNGFSGSLSYNYIANSHKLLDINGSSYSYDYKGNVTKDGIANVDITDYDYRNLPGRIVKSTSGTEMLLMYDDAGQRTHKLIVEGEEITNKEYYLYGAGSQTLGIYENGDLKSVNLFGQGLIGKLEFSRDEQGNEEIKRVYYLKDHLGSIRVAISEDGTVSSAQDYTPYGEYLRSSVTGVGKDKYKFTEKERDTETGLDYFGARYYNSKTGLWLAVDPLADKYPGWSPFNYVENDPLNYVDPNGEFKVKWYGKQVYFSRVSFWNATISNGLSMMPIGSLVGNIAKTAYDDPSLGQPGVVDYGLSFFGGKVGTWLGSKLGLYSFIGENASNIYGAVSGSLSWDDVWSANSIDQRIFNSLAKEEAYGVKILESVSIEDFKNGKPSKFGNGDGTTYTINPEFAKKVGYKKAAQYVTKKLHWAFAKENSELYRKLYGDRAWLRYVNREDQDTNEE